jgi:hypothetical protein
MKGRRQWICLLCLVLAALPARAVTRSWTNVLGGSWFTPTGWSPNGVPATTDNVMITNAGTIRKVGGTGSSSLGGCAFKDLPGALVQADTGTVAFGPNYTNTVAEFRLNGGTIAGAGGITVIGTALVSGSGSLRQNAILGGMISPGLGGPGAIAFPDGLNLGPAAVVAMDGTGLAAGTQYDQLTVGGSGVGYSVLATTNFIQWTNIGRATSDPAGQLHFIDTNAAKFRYRFYRMTN